MSTVHTLDRAVGCEEGEFRRWTAVLDDLEARLAGQRAALAANEHVAPLEFRAPWDLPLLPEQLGDRARLLLEDARSVTAELRSRM